MTDPEPTWNVPHASTIRCLYAAIDRIRAGDEPAEIFRDFGWQFDADAQTESALAQPHSQFANSERFDSAAQNAAAPKLDANQPEALRLADLLMADNYGAAETQIERRVAAELRRLHESVQLLEQENLRRYEENENLRSVMIAAAEAIAFRWEHYCDAEGYGPVNLMHRLEKGIPARYAYKAGDFARLHAEVGALRERLQFDGIHTCHADCQRPACVAVREAVAAERDRMTRKPLTDEQIGLLVGTMQQTNKSAHWLARAVEQVHRIGGVDE